MNRKKDEVLATGEAVPHDAVALGLARERISRDTPMLDLIES